MDQEIWASDASWLQSFQYLLLRHNYKTYTQFSPMESREPSKEKLQETTPWRTLYGSGDDKAMIIKTGVTKRIFDHVILPKFQKRWFFTPIIRSDVDNAAAATRPGRRTLCPCDALGLVLRYLRTSADPVTSLGREFGILPSTVHRYLDTCLAILHDCLRVDLHDRTRIALPTVEQAYAMAKSVESRYPLIKGCALFVAGLTLTVDGFSEDEDEERLFYDAGTSKYCITNLLVFGPDGIVYKAVVNAPGTYSEAELASVFLGDSLDYLCADNALWCCGDGAFGAIRGCLTPPKISPTAHNGALLEQFIQARRSAEWAMMTLRVGADRIIKGLPAIKHKRLQAMEIIVYLHQLRISAMGLNELARAFKEAYPEEYVSQDAEILAKMRK